MDECCNGGALLQERVELQPDDDRLALRDEDDVLNVLLEGRDAVGERLESGRPAERRGHVVHAQRGRFDLLLLREVADLGKDALPSLAQLRAVALLDGGERGIVAEADLDGVEGGDGLGDVLFERGVRVDRCGGRRR